MSGLLNIARFAIPGSIVELCCFFPLLLAERFPAFGQQEPHRFFSDECARARLPLLSRKDSELRVEGLQTASVRFW